MFICPGSRDIVSKTSDGDDHGRQGARLLLELTDLPRGFEAIHDWHVEVKENDAWFAFHAGRVQRRSFVDADLLAFFDGRFVGFYGFLAVCGDEPREPITVGNQCEKLQIDRLPLG